MGLLGCARRDLSQAAPAEVIGVVSSGPKLLRTSFPVCFCLFLGWHSAGIRMAFGGIPWHSEETCIPASAVYISFGKISLAFGLSSYPYYNIN